MIKKVVATLALTFAVGTLYAQFKISGEIRPRMEYRHGYKKLADSLADNALFIDQRTRLNFDYKQERLAFRVSL